MLRIGLTGSIATGKSTTARLFAEAGVPVHDADATVHALYEGKAVEPIGALIPTAISDGKVDRDALKAAIAAEPALLKRIESIVHPMVRAKELEAAEKAKVAGARMMLFDIPLLFETGSDKRMDVVVVTTCAPETQMARLMARPGMMEQTAKMLIERQMPDADKRKRAHFLVETDHGVDVARRRVRQILNALAGRG